MKILAILARPSKESFNHSIASAAVEELENIGHEIIFHDLLYEEKFDPILTSEEIPTNVPLPQEIEKHCEEISEAEGIIIVHPNWWGQPPAILKGWVDRIIRPGIAYECLEGDKREGIPNGLLQAKTAIIFDTSNTETEREKDVFGDPLETFGKTAFLI